jgi:hypothetical protein
MTSGCDKFSKVSMTAGWQTFPGVLQQIAEAA